MQHHSEKEEFVSFQFSGDAQFSRALVLSFGSMRGVDEFAGLGFMFVFSAGNV